MRNYRWLGREFLTWIWFKTETDGGTFDLPSSPIDIVIEDNLVMVSHDDESQSSSIKGGCPTLRPEAASALAGLMAARRAKITAARDEKTWTFTLDAETLDIKSAKLPKTEADDAYEQMAERLGFAEELSDAIAELFAHFVEVRLALDWETGEAQRMREWIREKVRRSDVGHGELIVGTVGTILGDPAP